MNPSPHDLSNSRLIPSDTSRPYLQTPKMATMATINRQVFDNCRSLWCELCPALWMVTAQDIDQRQKHIFNALSTGLTQLLGLSLADSLRSYKLLRWRTLAAAYRPLETFDLVLGCDSQINALRLLWRTRNSRYRYLPSRTQIFCLVWLSVNLVMAGIVSNIGLTYNLDTSDKLVLTCPGNINVMDISNLQSQNYIFDLNYVQNVGCSWGLGTAKN